MSIDDPDLNLAAVQLRRPPWPAQVPAFLGDAPPPEAPRERPIDLADARATRWTCQLSPARQAAWHAAPRGTLIVHAIDADPGVPLLLYWALRNAGALGTVVAALRATFARVIVAVPDDVPARWRAALRPLAPRAINAAYPAGHWRLLPRVLGLGPGEATLVLDSVAAIDLALPTDARPVAVANDDDEVVYRVVPRGARVGDVAPRESSEDEPVDVFAGPRLRARAVDDETAIGDGELTFHVAPRIVEERSPCVRCGWCVRACPTRCDPIGLAQLAQAPDARRAARLGLDACIDCGLCTAVCPSRLPLHGLIGELRDALAAAPPPGAAR